MQETGHQPTKPRASYPIAIPTTSIDATFSSTSTNLTSTSLGASILGVSDEYFAPADNLLKPEPAVRKPGVYVHTGAWYDGWETRRHNPRDFDWAVVRLGCGAVVDGVEVDTAHFDGNEATEVAVDGWVGGGKGEDEGGGGGGGQGGVMLSKEGFGGWEEILPKRPCGPNRRQAWRVAGREEGGDEGAQQQYTHLRLKMYPDGGIARLRVYGRAVPPPLQTLMGPSADPEESPPMEELSSALNGGVAVSCSDQHFGVKSNLLLPGRGKDMGDGWETARSRTEGHVDWVVCRMGLKARSVDQVVVDTKDFRGNYPRAIRVDAWLTDGDEVVDDPQADSEGWVSLVKGKRLCQADTEHVYQGEDLVSDFGRVGRLLTHVKLTIIPDGGVKRLRIVGRRA